MNKQNTSNKRRIAYNYLYATLIGLMVVSLAVIIALASANGATKTNISINNEAVPTAVTTFVTPIKNAVIVKDYSGSELQYNDTLKQWEIHKAVDFKAENETEVYSIADGTVMNVYTNYLEGTVIEISHANGLVSTYKSLANDTKVSVGEKVTAGQVIGNAGSTMAQELNSGAHLHFEMSKNGNKINPNDYLSLGNK